MMRSQDDRDRLLVALNERLKQQGIGSLSEAERVFWAASYAWGVIRHEGVHGFAFWFDQFLTREMALEAFVELGMLHVANCIVRVGELSLIFLEGVADDKLTSDEFRRRFESDFTQLELEIEKSSDEYENKSWVLCRAINEGCV